MSRFLFDLHVHPSIKPYGRSFDYNPAGQHAANPRSKHSIWYRDKPKGLDILANKVLNLTKFTQADFTSLARSDVRLVCACLYPLEKGFAKNEIGTGEVSDALINFITQLGKKRINRIQTMSGYFEDLVGEYNFFLQQNGRKVNHDNGDYRYLLVRDFNHLASEIAREEAALAANQNAVKNIYVFFSIEGLHVLNTGLGRPVNEPEVFDNLQKIKHWEYCPLYISVAHHFYNDLCGHAESLTNPHGGFDMQDWATRQEPGMNTPFTDLGRRLVRKMLDNTDGKRIYPDIKHMSWASRQDYYNMLQGEEAFIQEFKTGELPIIISHGACNGRKSKDNPIVRSATGAKMLHADINFYDDEIVLMKKSGGIIGLQLDERRIGNRSFINETNPGDSRSAKLHKKSKLLWNQIQHIVELLDKEGFFGWDCIAIGSDFDGIIDPIDGFWTGEYMDDLVQYTERHAFNYLVKNTPPLQHDFNKNIQPAEVIDRVFFSNAFEFLRKFYRSAPVV